jgi:hypothetical protein
VGPRDMPTEILFLDMKKLEDMYKSQILEACMLYCLDARGAGLDYSSTVQKATAIIEANTEFLFTKKDGFYLAYLVAIGDETTAHSYYETYKKEFEKKDLKEIEYSGVCVYKKTYLNEAPDELYWHKVLSKHDTTSATMVFLKRFWSQMLITNVSKTSN